MKKYMLISLALSFLASQAEAAVKQSAFTVQQQKMISDITELGSRKNVIDQEKMQMTELFNQLTGTARSINELILVTSLPSLQKSAQMLLPYQGYAINKFATQKANGLYQAALMSSKDGADAYLNFIGIILNQYTSDGLTKIANPKLSQYKKAYVLLDDDQKAAVEGIYSATKNFFKAPSYSKLVNYLQQFENGQMPTEEQKNQLDLYAKQVVKLETGSTVYNYMISVTISGVMGFAYGLLDADDQAALQTDWEKMSEKITAPMLARFKSKNPYYRALSNYIVNLPSDSQLIINIQNLFNSPVIQVLPAQIQSDLLALVYQRKNNDLPMGKAAFNAAIEELAQAINHPQE